MNKKAEMFKQYIDEQKITGFEVTEPENEPNHLALFRSNIRLEGNMVPFGVFVDDTPFAMIRFAIAPEAIHDDNREAMTRLANDLNNKYKPYKFYFDRDHAFMAESCVLLRDDEKEVGGAIHFILNLAIKDITNEYKGIMQAVWGAEKK
jgi:hypothetical protein